MRKLSYGGPSTWDWGEASSGYTERQRIHISSKERRTHRRGCSAAKSCPTLCNPRKHSRLPYPSLFPGVCSNSCPLVGDANQPSHSLSPPCLLPSVFPSIRVFSNESALYIRWPKSWSFSISPSNEFSGLISFGIDWFDLLAFQRVFCNTTIQKYQSSVLSLLYGPTIISIHDYWKNHSFEYVDLCWQSNVSAF